MRMGLEIFDDLGMPLTVMWLPGKSIMINAKPSDAIIRVKRIIELKRECISCIPYTWGRGYTTVLMAQVYEFMQ